MIDQAHPDPRAGARQTTPPELERDMRARLADFEAWTRQFRATIRRADTARMIPDDLIGVPHH